MTGTLTEQDEATLRTAAYGAITLLAAAGATGRPHKIAREGAIALASATGLVGHVLARNPRGDDVDGGSVAEIADRVLPALTAAVGLLKRRAPAEVENFRGTVLLAVGAAVDTQQGDTGPALAEMTRKIAGALDAG
ncbi:hypothetical protein GCM10029964_035450 [Kibdelosporangium lantanae]